MTLMTLDQKRNKIFVITDEKEMARILKKARYTLLEETKEDWIFEIDLSLLIKEDANVC